MKFGPHVGGHRSGSGGWTGIRWFHNSKQERAGVLGRRELGVIRKAKIILRGGPPKSTEGAVKMLQKEGWPAVRKDGLNRNL